MAPFIRRAAFALVLALPLTAQADLFGDGLVALQQGDVDQAVEVWTTLAEQGDPEAQVNLAFMYDMAHGVDRNPALARHWYTQAAAQGNIIAEVNLAHMYETGDGVERNMDEALRLYQQAAYQGDTPSRKWLLEFGIHGAR